MSRERQWAVVAVSDALRSSGAGTEIEIMVSPNAKDSEIGEVDQWRKRLLVKVTAPPEGGRANREVEELFSKVLGCKAEIVKGHLSRMKTVFTPITMDRAASLLEDAQ